MVVFIQMFHTIKKEKIKITFLENGIDSLNKGFKSLKVYEENLYLKTGVVTDKERFFQLKDAIIQIHHGIEILLKYILTKENELLVFSEINKYVKLALKEKRKRKLESIFQTSVKNRVHTVTF